MKKFLIAVLCFALVLPLGSTAAFAEGEDTTTSTEQTTETTTTTDGSTVTDETADQTSTTGETTDQTGTTDGTTTDGTTTDGTTTDGTDEEEAGVTPDSILYPLERLMESIQVILTFSADGKAELLVECSKERLAEAEIMTQENR